MTNSVNRYGCNYYYSNEGYEGPGMWTIAFSDSYFDTSDECFDGEMETYIINMNGYLLNSESGMCEYSGCYRGEPSTALFRSSMLGYNTNAAQYKALFLAGVRECLSEYPEEYSRATVLGWLNSAMSGYRACIAYSSTSPCYRCDR
jgi:hypothetical protein